MTAWMVPIIVLALVVVATVFVRRRRRSAEVHSDKAIVP